MKVDFYLLNNSELKAYWQLICRLTEKAYRQQAAVYINVADETLAEQLDQALWQYPKSSFLPHAKTSNASPLDSILLGINQKPASHYKLMLNCGNRVPEFYRQFTRILEVVSSDEKNKQQARCNYRQYQQANCQLQHHPAINLKVSE